MGECVRDLGDARCGGAGGGVQGPQLPNPPSP